MFQDVLSHYNILHASNLEDNILEFKGTLDNLLKTKFVMKAYNRNFFPQFVSTNQYHHQDSPTDFFNSAIQPIQLQQRRQVHRGLNLQNMPNFLLFCWIIMDTDNIEEADSFNFSTGCPGPIFEISIANNFFLEEDRPIVPLSKKCPYGGTF